MEAAGKDDFDLPFRQLVKSRAMTVGLRILEIETFSLPQQLRVCISNCIVDDISSP
jgi:hypothetical protein